MFTAWTKIHIQQWETIQPQHIFLSVFGTDSVPCGNESEDNRLYLLTRSVCQGVLLPMTVYSPRIADATKSTDVENLYKKHVASCRQGRSPEEILAMFYDDQWFQKTLTIYTNVAIAKSKGLACCPDDIKQDALILVHRALQRRSCLGYDPGRGAYEAFFCTILRRSCQRALWQFRHTSYKAIEFETQHPYHDPRVAVDENLDLVKQIELLEQPHRSVFEAICLGQSVDQIAASQKKSRRTIYRWLKAGMKTLEKQLA